MSANSKDWSGQSSQVEMTHYKPDTQEMIVKFKFGGLYSYASVTQSTWDKSLDAISIGKFINETIKPNHPYTKLN